MKGISLIALLFLYYGQLTAQDTIKFTGFEGDTSEWKGIVAGVLGDTIGILTGDTTTGFSDTPAFQRIATGTRSWQIINDTSQIRLDSVRIAQYDSVRLSLRFSGTATDQLAGLDLDDSIKVFIAVNGQAFDSIPNLIITGSVNSKFGFDADSIIYVKVDSQAVYTAPFGIVDTLSGASTAVLEIKPEAFNVRVLIVASNNQGTEVWNLDDIILSGQLKRALPIGFNGFQARKHDKGVELKWSAGFEPAGIEYIIERSQNGHIFSTLDILAGGSGEDVHGYTYLDRSPVKAWNYYRIRQSYPDGSQELSEIKSVFIPSEKSTVVFPTIIDNYLNISSTENGIQRYQIVNAQGQRIRTGQINLDNSSARIQLPDCIPGIYFISLYSGQKIKTFPFIKN